MAWKYDADGSLTGPGGAGVPPVIYNRILIIDTIGQSIIPVPSDFTAVNRVHLIGGGQCGSNGEQRTSAYGGSGGDGGSYVRLNDVPWSPLTNIDITVADFGTHGGAGRTKAPAGNDTFIEIGGTIIALAPGGFSLSLPIGDTFYPGGIGIVNTISSESPTGGGGAGGPNGAGANGGARTALSIAGTGGGAANGGLPGGNTPNGGNSIGGNGGSYGAIPGGAGGSGAANGSPGVDGSGGGGAGGGGGSGVHPDGGAGSFVPLWTDGTLFYGPGSGGGASGVLGSSSTATGSNGGDGGKYGGGGGGAGQCGNSNLQGPGIGGLGGQGLVVIEWFVP